MWHRLRKFAAMLRRTTHPAKGGMMSVVLEPDVLHNLEVLAEHEKRTPSEIVADALELYKSTKGKKLSDIEFLMAITGIGSSEEDDISERDEEILASEVDPIRGWRVDDSDRDAT
jgi:predicted transcriptional regulator